MGILNVHLSSLLLQQADPFEQKAQRNIRSFATEVYFPASQIADKIFAIQSPTSRKAEI